MSRRFAIVTAAIVALVVGIVGVASAENALTAARKVGKLVIGTDATYPPFEQKIGDRFEGFDIDLGNEIGKEIGIPIAWRNIAWDGAFPALKVGKFDLLMSSVDITPERKRELAFSRPYFLSVQSVARRKGDTRINRLEDLKGKRPTVQIQTTGQKALEKIGIPTGDIGKFNTLQLALLEVHNGNADGCVGDMPALSEMIRKGYPDMELVGSVLTNENVGVTMRRGDPKLLAAVNEALGKIFADGRYAKIYAKWLGGPPPAGYMEKLDAAKNEGTPVANTSVGSPFTFRWDVLKPALPLLLGGCKTTIVLTAATLAFGIPLGLIIALLRLSGIKPVELLMIAYIEVVRGTPLLMQIYVIYFVLPGLHIRLDALLAGIVALTINAGAYVAEIFRAGIESIDTGQMEAARSLGMDYATSMRFVILPQSVRRVLPPLTNEAVALLKDSSLVSVIALSELMRVGSEQASNSGSAFTIYIAVAALYLAMTLPLTYLVRRLELKWQPISSPRRRRAPAPA